MPDCFILTSWMTSAWTREEWKIRLYHYISNELLTGAAASKNHWICYKWIRKCFWILNQNYSFKRMGICSCPWRSNFILSMSLTTSVLADKYRVGSKKDENMYLGHILHHTSVAVEVRQLLLTLFLAIIRKISPKCVYLDKSWPVMYNNSSLPWA